MLPLCIERKEDTPEIQFDKNQNTFCISGRSLPEDILEFYTPVYYWLQDYVKQPNETTVVKMDIDYFNSASHKAIGEILEILSEIKTSGKTVEIHWHYLEDDVDMKESGEDFQELTGLNFVFHAYNAE